MLEDQWRSGHTYEDENDLPAHSHDLFQGSMENVSAEHHAEVLRCLVEFQDVFSKLEDDIGPTDLNQPCIDTGSAMPIQERPRRHPFRDQHQIMHQVENLDKRDIN